MLDMISCPNCFHLNPPDTHLCERCQNALKTEVRICSNCGRYNPVDAWSCNRCGTTLSTDTISEVDIESVQQESRSNADAQIAGLNADAPELESPTGEDSPEIKSPQPSTPRLVENRCQAIGKYGVLCERRPILGGRWCWRHNTPVLVSLIAVAGGLLILLGFWTGVINYTYVSPDTTYAEANTQGDEALIDEQYDVALAYYKYALKKARGASNDIDERLALIRIGETYTAQGEYDKAQEYFREADAAQILYDWGVSSFKQGDHRQALEYFQVALPLVREENNQEWEGNLLNLMAISSMNQDEYDQAYEYLNQALTVSQETGDQSLELIVINNLGIYYKLQGETDLALEYFTKAGNSDELYTIGLKKLEQKEYDQALDIFNLILSMGQKQGNQKAQAVALNSLGGTYALKGQFEQALEYYNHTLKIRLAIGENIETGRTLFNIGEAYSSLGKNDEALEYYDRALSIFRNYGTKEDEERVVEEIESLQDE